MINRSRLILVYTRLRNSLTSLYCVVFVCVCTVCQLCPLQTVPERRNVWSVCWKMWWWMCNVIAACTAIWSGQKNLQNLRCTWQHVLEVAVACMYILSCMCAFSLWKYNVFTSWSCVWLCTESKAVNQVFGWLQFCIVSAVVIWWYSESGR